MSKRFYLTESEKEEIRKFYNISEDEKKDDRKFCHAGNTKSLEEIMGDDEDDDYIEGVRLRKNGVRGLVDKLELLKDIWLNTSNHRNEWLVNKCTFGCFSVERYALTIP